MSYLALYRKYRSQTFEELLGQQHVVKALQNAVKRGKVGHAYLFCGPRGTGKTSVARLLAKALNCVQGPTPTPCNVCDRCQAITQGSSMDVKEIDGASNRRIDDIRTLREQVKYVSAEGGYKIYVIDEVHMLVDEAFNALLKTLEEPPPDVIFVLATTHPQDLPETIISRCQRFDFKRAADEQIVTLLRKVAEAEGIPATEDALKQLARAANGSFRDSLSFLESAISFAEGQLTRDVVDTALGTVPLDLLNQAVEILKTNQSGQVFSFVADLSAAGVDYAQFVRDFSLHLRELLLQISTADEAGAGKVTDLSPALLLRWINELAVCDRRMRDDEQHRVLLEITLYRMSLPQDASLHSPDGAPVPGDNRIAPQAASPRSPSRFSNPKPPAPPGASGPSPSPETPAAVQPSALNMKIPSSGDPALDAAWLNTLARLKQESPVTYLMAKEGAPVSLEEDVLTLRFGLKHKMQRETCDRPDRRQPLEAALREELGRPVRVNLVSADLPPSIAAVRARTEDELAVERAKVIFDATEVE